MNPSEFTPLPNFTRSTLPDAASNTLLRDVMVVVEEPDGATRTVLISNGRTWASVGGGSSSLAAMDITGSITLNSATHGNRHLSWTGATPGVLTLGTGNAGDIIEVTNDGTAPLYFLGVSAASLAAGNRGSINPGETFGGVYSAANWDSITTPPVIKTGRQPSFLILPNPGGITPSAVGWGAPGHHDSSTATGVSMTLTSQFTRTQRQRATGAAAAISRMAGPRANPAAGNPLLVLTPGAAAYEWTARLTGGISDAIAAGQFGMGFCAQNLIQWTNAVEPSSMVDCFMLAGDSTDGQLSIMHNNGAGACVKDVLNGGVGFPNNTNSTDMYELVVRCVSDGTNVFYYYTVTNLSTLVSVSGVVTSELPVTVVGFGVFCCRGSANVATTPLVDWAEWAAGAFA